MTAVLEGRPQCRWALHCTYSATAVVTVATLKMRVTACAEHAEDHKVWSDCDGIVLNRGAEPLPECWCPDNIAPLPLETRRREVPYCPRCGTDAERGLTGEDL